MNQELLRNAYLSAVSGRLEVEQTPRGYVVWAPLFYSDGDGVVLSVYPSGDGWLVTDEASTLAHLADSGAAVGSAAFTTAWESLPTAVSFIPSHDRDPACIQAWTDEDGLGRAMADVAEAAVRAEGLVYVSDRRGGRRPFGRTVRDRARFLLSAPALASAGLSSGGGRITLRSGRSAQFTDTITHGDRPVTAIQAISGQSKDSRTQSHDHAFTMFSQSPLEKANHISVLADPDGWDPGMRREIETVSEVVDLGNLDQAMQRVLTPYVRHDSLLTLNA